MPSLRRSRLPLLLARHRRGVVALLLSVAAGAAVLALAPPAPPTVSVLVAAHDLAAGVMLAPADVRVSALSEHMVPSGALVAPGDTVGRVLAAPVRAGEPLTDVRLVGPALLRSLPDGQVGAPLQLADADVAALLRPGDLVDVVAAPPHDVAGGSTAPRVVAERVRVLAVSTPRSAGALGVAADSVPLVLVAAPPATAVDLAAASVTQGLAVVLRPG